jgi:hypothetical protein
MPVRYVLDRQRRLFLGINGHVVINGRAFSCAATVLQGQLGRYNPCKLFDLAVRFELGP